MLNTVAHRQANRLTYSAETTQAMKLEATGAVTRIALLVDLDPSATMVAAAEVEATGRLIDTLKVVGGGGRVYFDIGNDAAGRMIQWLSRYEGIMRGTGHSKLGTSVYVLFLLHFGSRPQHRLGWDNPYDMSAFIPAFDDELRIEWGCPTTAQSIDDTQTIDVDTFMYATVYELTGSASDLRQEMARQGVARAMVPTSTYYVDTPGATAYTDYQREFDVPTGNYMRRILIMSHDDDTNHPERTDLEMTGIAVVFPKVGQRFLADDFAALSLTQGMIEPEVQDAQALTYGVNSLMGGMACLDFRQHGDRDYGLDLRNYRVGDVKTGATIAGNAAYDQFYWYDQVQEYFGL